MIRYHELTVLIECPDGSDSETVLRAVVGLAESRGWFCGGSVKEVDREGNPVGGQREKFRRHG